MLAPQLVQIAEHPPFHCVLTGSVSGPFVDCGTQIESIPHQYPRAYFSAVSAHQIGAAIGMVSAEEHQKTLNQLEQAQRDLDEQERELNRLEQQADAIAALTKGDYQIRKPVGRPKQRKKEEVA